MKHLSVLSVIILLSASLLTAQKKDEKVEKKQKEYEFTDVKILPHTSVKNQASSGTCWSFSGSALLESEIIRTKGDTVNLSAMWVVRNIYREKLEKYVRMHGEINLAAGGSFADVIHAGEKYGLVPEQIYQGLNYGFDSHNHGELDKIIKGFGDALIGVRKLSTAWGNALDGVLDAYLGKIPEKFNYSGTEYTPVSFMKHCGLNFSDYLSFTSYTHHPFYSSFILEIPDNWIYELSYNVPMNELLEIIDNAMNTGYTVAWGADVSERSFSRDIATVPEEKKTEEIGSDQAKWTKKKQETVVEELPNEKQITQEMRQTAFDNYETTDDHGMLIVGTAKDQTGKQFFKVKNSWGNGGKYKGYLYASRAYVQYKTMNIVVHKDAVPEHIKVKLKAGAQSL
ncbi:MAG: C1 family peptidase [Prevotellaceae bacterium]|jgi:aminopeptidase C|nr:C1 family peptidase [Prevotellaceae bacterium]